MRMLVKNRKATHEYEIIDKFVAGIVLKGFETKSILQGNCSLAEGYVSIKNNEAFLKQVHVDKYRQANSFDDIDEKRDRKLLLNKSEIRKIAKSTQEKGLTVIPLDLHYSDTKKIKLTIAIAKGKKTYDKRHALKQKQIDIELKRKMK